MKMKWNTKKRQLIKNLNNYILKVNDNIKIMKDDYKNLF